MTETPTDLEAQCIFNELRTKRRMEQGVSSSTASALEAQLNCLIKAVTDATDAATKEMMKYSLEGFEKVRTTINSIYDVVLKRA